MSSECINQNVERPILVSPPEGRKLGKAGFWRRRETPHSCLRPPAQLEVVKPQNLRHNLKPQNLQHNLKLQNLRHNFKLQKLRHNFKPQKLRHNLPSSLKSCEEGWGRPKGDWEDIGTNCNVKHLHLRKEGKDAMMPEYRTQGNKNIDPNTGHWTIWRAFVIDRTDCCIDIVNYIVWSQTGLERVCEKWNSMVDEGVRLHPFYKLLQVREANPDHFSCF